MINEDEKSKRDYLKKFLISSHTQENVNKDFIKQCHSKLSQMSPIQLRILSIFDSPNSVVYSVVSAMINQGKQEITIPDDFNDYDLRVDKMVFETALNDLKSFGMMLNKEMKKTGHLKHGGQNKKARSQIDNSLQDMKINASESSRWQKPMSLILEKNSINL